jgi:hypothetical protein
LLCEYLLLGNELPHEVFKEPEVHLLLKFAEHLQLTHAIVVELELKRKRYFYLFVQVFVGIQIYFLLGYRGPRYFQRAYRKLLRSLRFQNFLSHRLHLPRHFDLRLLRDVERAIVTDRNVRALRVLFEPFHTHYGGRPSFCSLEPHYALR